MRNEEIVGLISEIENQIDINEVGYIREKLEEIYNSLKNGEFNEYTGDEIFVRVVENINKHISEATNANNIGNVYKYKTIEYILKNHVYINNILSNPNPNIKLETKLIEFKRLIEKQIKNPELTEEIEDQIFLKFGNEPVEEIEEEERELYKYGINIKKNIIVLFSDVIRDAVYDKSEEYKKRLKEGKLTTEERRELKTTIIKELEEFKKRTYKDEIVNMHIEQLTNVVKTLVEDGSLEENNEINNKRLNKYNLDFLEFPYEGNNNLKEIYITDLQNPEFVGKFKDSEIIGMNAFYTNRLTKVIKVNIRILYIAKKVGIFDKLAEKEKWENNTTDEELIKIIDQQSFIGKIIDDILLEKISKGESFDNERMGEVIESEEYSDVLDRVKKLYENKYNNYYTKFWLPNMENNFIKDLEAGLDLGCEKSNMYRMKDLTIRAILMNLLDKTDKTNWGYICEDVNGRNSIERKTRY